MLNANSLTSVALVTALVLFMVFVMPLMDRRICRRLGVNLQGGVSQNPKADELKRLRQGLLLAVFGLYLLVLAWLVFFSRGEAGSYLVHVALFEDLQSAIQIDLGFFGVIRILFTQGPQAALSHIRVIKPEDIAQVYMNIALFVPMGYLLPYTFRWFRARVRHRPVICCFLVSLLIENVQLITKRGFYDMDDLVSNTLGGLIGQVLYISVAYVVTHPDWRRELKAYRRWKRNARQRTLYPFARRMDLMRTTLTATGEEAIWDFYVMKLGFRLRRQLIPLDRPGTDLLLEMGGSQVEVHCLNEERELPPQFLTLSVRRLNPVLRRLKANGIQLEPVTQDPYTALPCVSFSGPDGVRVTVIEK